MSENQEQPMENLDDLRAQRVQKLNKIVENGGNAYGHRVDDITPSTVVKEIAPTLAEGEVKKVRVAGRMIARRIMGKSLFASLRDRNDSIQLYVQKNVVGDDEYAKFKELDLGDIISAEGEIFVTRTGEPSGWDSSGRTFFSSAMDEGLVVLWMRLTGFLTMQRRWTAL